MYHFYIPKVIIGVLMFTGAGFLIHYLMYLSKLFTYKYIYKKPYMTPEQLKYFIMLEENKKLKQKISLLEEENEKIFSSLINKLN
jgi:hypothetical protein